jgi:WD40 repeat protein
MYTRRKIQGQGGMDSATDPRLAASQPRVVYNAFLSYSHSADERLASVLQRALHQFAKRPFQLRALRVFFDTASLAANPALWPAIEHALHASEYLILMASPQAAASAWVEKEIDYWRRNKPATNLLIALTTGEIAWDERACDFDWTKTTALPVGLSRVFEAEPLWVDLRWAQESGSSLLAHPRFRDCVADLAAPLHGRAKDDLIGEDVRQARRLRRLMVATIALLASLAAALGWMSLVADRRRQIAALERDQALKSQSRYLADAALGQIAEGNPEVGVLLALEALPKVERERPYVAGAEAALHTALSALGPRKTVELREDRPPVSSASFSPDGKRLVTVDAEETARVWDADTGAQVLTLRGHQEPVWFAAYLPDGSGIVTVSADSTARLWNAATGEQVRVFQGHQGPVLHAAISSDGRLLATASADSTARVWQIETGSVVATLRGHTQELCCIQISPDGSRIATASVDGTSRLWKTRSGKMLAVFKGTPQTISVPAGQGVVLRFSPDGKLAATSHEDNAVRLWYASDGSPAAVLKGASGEINDGAFSNDSHFFAAASADGTARLWRLRWEDDKLAPVSEANVLHEKQETPNSREPTAVVFSPENDFVATAGEDFLQIWDPANGAELATLELEAPASSIVMSPDGRRFATIHLDHVTLWRVAGSNFTGWRLQEEREQIDRADRGPIIESSATGPGFTWTDQSGWEPPVAITRDARTAAVVTGRRVVLLNAQTGRVISTIAAHSRVVSRAVFNAAGDRLLTTSYDGSAKIWDARNGGILATLSGHEGPIVDGVFSPADDLVATASEDRTVRLWDTNGGPKSVLRGHTAAVRQVAFSSDARRIITVSDDRTARVWDAASGRGLSTLHRDKNGFGVAALNASGDRAVTAGSGNDYMVQLWETAAAKELHHWQESRGTVIGLAFSSDGRTVLSWGADGSVRLRNAQGLYDRFSDVGFGCAGPGSIKQAYLSDDGERIVTILKNGRTDLWDSRSGTPVMTLHTFPNTRGASPCEIPIPPTGPEAASVALSPDLHNVLVDGDNGAVVLFTLPSRAEAIRRARQLVPRSLTPEERRRFFLTE